MKTITLIADYRDSLLSEISYVLGKTRIFPEAMNIQKAGEKAIISIATEEPVRTEEALRTNNYDLSRSGGLFLKCSDVESGEIKDVSKMLRSHRIKIINKHIIAKDPGSYILALDVNRPRAAIKLLQEILLNKPF